jgi:hypothetical protein
MRILSYFGSKFIDGMIIGVRGEIFGTNLPFSSLRYRFVRCSLLAKRGLNCILESFAPS